MRTVAGVLASLPEAERAARDLEHIGVPTQDIHVLAGNDQKNHDQYLKAAKEKSTSAGAAAASGASFGGGVGIVAGLIALAIPGVGTFVAGTAIATVLTGLGIGAASGALLGAFKNMGISHEEAPLYEEAVRRGAVVFMAHVNEDAEQEAMAILNRHGAQDLREQSQDKIAHPEPTVSSISASEPAETFQPRSGARSYDFER